MAIADNDVVRLTIYELLDPNISDGLVSESEWLLRHFLEASLTISAPIVKAVIKLW